MTLDQVCAYKHAVHETHVGVEAIRNTGARLQIRSGSSYVKIRHTDETLEIENHRGVASFGVRATGVGVRCGTIHRSREVDVSAARRWCIDVRDRYRKIAKSR